MQGIATKESLYRFVFKVGDELTSTAVKGDARHHRSDVISSAAAFVGISIALISGKGYESADDWAALLAWVIILIQRLQSGNEFQILLALYAMQSHFPVVGGPHELVWRSDT